MRKNPVLPVGTPTLFSVLYSNTWNCGNVTTRTHTYIRPRACAHFKHTHTHVCPCACTHFKHTHTHTQNLQQERNRRVVWHSAIAGFIEVFKNHQRLCSSLTLSTKSGKDLINAFPAEDLSATHRLSLSSRLSYFASCFIATNGI